MWSKYSYLSSQTCWVHDDALTWLLQYQMTVFLSDYTCFIYFTARLIK
jgi:hypothetical protein